MDTSNRPSLNQLSEILAERSGRQHDYGFKQELKVLIHLWRQRLLVDSLNAKPEDRKFFRVWLDLPVIDVPISDFPNFPNNHCIRRTRDCIPKSIRANSTLFDFVGYLNKSTVIPIEDSMQAVEIMSQSKYTGNLSRGVYINGYIYVTNFTGPAISVSLIPEDMSEVSKIECFDCGTNDCYSDDSPYPVSGDIGQRIIQAILATELNRNVVDLKTQEIPISDDSR